MVAGCWLLVSRCDDVSSGSLYSRVNKTYMYRRGSVRRCALETVPANSRSRTRGLAVESVTPTEELIKKLNSER
jgi:hypothetical protein